MGARRLAVVNGANIFQMLLVNVVECYSDSKDRYCISIIDPSRPAWFLRHYNHFVSLEPEYGARNSHVFDADASFILIPDQFSPEFFALESVNYPGYFVRATDDGRLRIAEYDDTPEFRHSASFALTDHFVERTSDSILSVQFF